MFLKKKAAGAVLLCIIGCASAFLYMGEREDRHPEKPVRTAPSVTEDQKALIHVRAEENAVSRLPAPPPHPNQKAKAKVSAPFVSQKPELPNGCEITSLTMLLNSADIPVDKMTLAREIKKVPFSSDKYMGNPNEGFVGNMYHGNKNNPGLAVYHGPIADLAGKYLGDRVIDLTGSNWTRVERQISQGQPVWVITSINFQPVPDSGWRTWRTRQGTLRISFLEHSVLVTGYDSEHVYFNDPLSNRHGSKASKPAFIKVWKQFGSQAVSYKKADIDR
ncbi:hypothetical protein EWI07_05945 [Sporolactobacillus sp. THM7-4]|nr:hypothetical protein EWI07_05945 [Sporolactobacillus sp. THM7-4]